jgi:hypothetical protein
MIKLMKKINDYGKLVLAVAIALFAAGLTGCATSQKMVRETQVVVEESHVTPDPGAVEYVWEPPIIDVIDVPPGLDPEGHYYRPAHQEIVEIRPGRWQYYKQSDNR